MTFAEQLRQHSPIPLSDEQVITLNKHYDLLVKWNRVMNLTTVEHLDEVVVRHYCESLFIVPYLPPGTLTIADIGSGAGFPGFPVAVARPDCFVTLVESHRRKAVFLKEASRQISNIRVLACRSQDVSEQFDWVISRAVRRQEVCGLGIGGNYALLIGSDGEGIHLPWGNHLKLCLSSTSST